MTHSLNEMTFLFKGYSSAGEAVEAILTKIVELTDWERENNTLYFDADKKLKIVVSAYNYGIKFSYYNNNTLLKESYSGDYHNGYSLYYHASTNGTVIYISINKAYELTFLVATNLTGEKTIFYNYDNSNMSYTTSKYSTYYSYSSGLLVYERYPYSISEATDFINYSVFPELYYVKSYPVGTLYNMLANFNGQAYRFVATLNNSNQICYAFPVSDE